MKHLFLLFVFLFPVMLYAQWPNNPRKLRQGYQTTGEGIVYYGSGVPSYTPSSFENSYHYMDTLAAVLYQYDRIGAEWERVGGTGAETGSCVLGVSQSSHGFSDFDPVLRRTAGYVLASDSTGMDGIVIDSVTVDSFRLQVCGYYTGAHSFTLAQDYFIQTDGTLSTTPDTVNAWALTILDTNVVLIRDVRPTTDTTGASNISSLGIDGDSGTAQGLVNGDTIRIVGGDGIATVAGATDQVTVALDINSLPAGTVSGSDFVAVWDVDGLLHYKEDLGTLTYDGWNLSAGGGPTTQITDAETVNFNGSDYVEVTRSTNNINIAIGAVADSTTNGRDITIGSAALDAAAKYTIFARQESGVTASDIQITLPTPSISYSENTVIIAVEDDDGTYNVTLNAGANEIWNAGTLTNTVTLANHSVTQIHVMNYFGVYKWVIK